MMNLKNLTQFLTVLLALNFCGQIAYNTSIVHIVQEIDFDQDSEKEESKDDKESDKFSHKQIQAHLNSLSISNLQSNSYLNWWKAPSIEVSDPPPESV